MLLWSLATVVFAQSNELIDELLAEEQATFGNSVYLVLSAAGIIDEQSSIQEAIDTLADQNWDIEIRPVSAQIRLGEYAFILMKSFHMQGGIMFSIFPCPRYASRELAFLGMVPGSASAGRSLSGEEVMYILGKALDWQGS
jgi:hypothetical protein